MAALGKRNVKDKKISGVGSHRPAAVIMQGLNLTIQPALIQPVATQPITVPSAGLPIMREGFVTETGFLQSNQLD